MNNPVIRDLFLDLGRDAAFQSLLQSLRAPGSIAALSGLTRTAKAIYLVLLWQATERPMLVLTESSKSAEALAETVETFFHLLVPQRTGGHTQLLPAYDILPGQKLSPHNEIKEARAVALWRMATGKASITIAPIGAALWRAEPAGFYRQLTLTLKPLDEIAPEDLTDYLQGIGYERREPVEMVGDFSQRGGILDVFPPESSKPVRIEFFGDSIESLRRFEVDSQRSVLKVSDCQILPLTELPRTRELTSELGEWALEPGWEFYAAKVRERSGTIAGLLQNPVIVWDEPEQIATGAERYQKRLEQYATDVLPPALNFFTLDDLFTKFTTSSRLLVRELDLATLHPDAPAVHISSRPSLSFHGNWKVAAAESRTLVEQGNRVIFFAPSTGEVERLADILREYSIPFQLGLDPSEGTPEYLAERSYFAAGPGVSTFIVKGLVARGTMLPDAAIAVIGAEDLYDASPLAAKPGSALASVPGAFKFDMADLKEGDYVVHAVHGVGKFLGVRELGEGDQRGDFMLIEYAGEAKLYVPLTRLDLIDKHRGGGETQTPSLDRMGGATWAKTKSRVKAKMRDMADELIKLYAERKMAEGFGFSTDSNWQREFEEAFEFTETRDQLTSLDEIKRDMESEHPMDRLLCGDVGFGKTEVAMRAAFKALGDGKQVAVLAPTTVLAFQHFESFKRRFAPFPVRIEMASRFVDAKAMKTVISDVALGKVDILIGTHRLFSKDIEFRDLGLLIVDEEQRFGVRHKERLKQLKMNVDVLTMSATPIPRTLHMSLVGLRDMSVIETPPKDRLSIHTVVAHFDSMLIKTAIEQELGRGGQVYFIHNRVDTIFARGAHIQDLVPAARIGIGHGQMGEDELERVLLGFMNNQYDVFVCTTIAENGLDIPLANTIIIENAERYGLSELYQLRGRVGRSNRRAYAYLLTPGDKTLSEIARKRLAALREFSDLGAGFKIAALDLQLRGAGNLLGGEQHGHIEAVGYDTYVRLLDETVRELKGEELPLEIRSNLSLGLDIRIPPQYIHDEHQRLRAYKRIADAGDEEKAGQVLSELEDRYGPPPDVVRNLVSFSVLKSAAERLGIETVERRSGVLNIKFHGEARVQPERLMALVANTTGAQFTPAGVLRLPLPAGDDPRAVLDFLGDCMTRLAGPVTLP
ncbi:MAG TPA: transcription-repair coupling factor [Bryobacteraceae bacterium]|nr:transcription-repair coupling factor [Bryobacteraceae bacterium]